MQEWPECTMAICLRLHFRPPTKPKAYGICRVEVAGKTKVMADPFIASSGRDITPAFLAYLRPLLGSGLSRPARLRGGAIAKVLSR
jgi:hypothetical protein